MAMIRTNNDARDEIEMLRINSLFEILQTLLSSQPFPRPHLRADSSYRTEGIKNY